MGNGLEVRAPAQSQVQSWAPELALRRNGQMGDTATAFCCVLFYDMWVYYSYTLDAALAMLTLLGWVLCSMSIVSGWWQLLLN